MTKEEIVNEFFRLEQSLKDKSNQLIGQGLSREEIRERLDKDMRVFADFAYANEEIIGNALKAKVKEMIDDKKLKPGEVIFIYSLFSNFNPTNFKDI